MFYWRHLLNNLIRRSQCDLLSLNLSPIKTIDSPILTRLGTLKPKSSIHHTPISHYRPAYFQTHLLMMGKPQNFKDSMVCTCLWDFSSKYKLSFFTVSFNDINIQILKWHGDTSDVLLWYTFMFALFSTLLVFWTYFYADKVPCQGLPVGKTHNCWS